MTRTITFTQEIAYPGLERASITVELIPSVGARFDLPVILDTGAAISKFDHAIAARLGITDIRSSTNTFPARAVDNEITTAYVHDVAMMFLGRPLTIPVAFCPDWPTGGDNLLGMEGFFEHAVFAFDHVKRRVYVKV